MSYLEEVLESQRVDGANDAAVRRPFPARGEPG